mgnify:CR=1 FL=1
MTESVVTCRICRTKKDEPRKWRHLCEECAIDCQEKHLSETGHQAELLVVQESMDELLTVMSKVRFW